MKEQTNLIGYAPYPTYKLPVTWEEYDKVAINYSPLISAIVLHITLGSRTIEMTPDRYIDDVREFLIAIGLPEAAGVVPEEPPAEEEPEAPVEEEPPTEEEPTEE